MSEKISEKKTQKVEEYSKSIEEVVMEIIEPYSADLDDYVFFIKGVLSDDEKPPTDTELEDFAMNLSTFIYYTSVGCEQLSIRDDIARTAYKEAYNIARNSIDKGTVADKNAEAELQASQERVVSIIYETAYKILKAKTESAKELLASVKKTMSRRIAELDLSKIQTNN